MAGYGGYNPYPRSYGGDVQPIETVHQALLDDVGRYQAVEDGTLGHIETYAEAAMVDAAWAGALASHNAFIALRMSYSLPTYEEAFWLRPKPTDAPVARRRALDAKMRSMGDNAEADIRDMCERLMGANFVGLTWVDSAEDVTYWPGIYPGPPGFDWASNREIVLVEVNKDGLTQEGFRAKRAKLIEMLDDLIPSHMAFSVYLHNTSSYGTGFVLGVSLLGETGL